MNTDQIIDLDLNTQSDKIEVETINAWKFVLLFILSFGLYSVWWMYNTWRFFKEKESLDIMPVWRSIFSIFFIYGLFKRIADLAQEVSTSYRPYSSGLLAALYIILSFCSRLNDPWWMITVFAGFCFIQPVTDFTFALANSEQHKSKDTGMTIGQIIIIILGGLLWGLIFIGLTLPAEPEF